MLSRITLAVLGSLLILPIPAVAQPAAAQLGPSSVATADWPAWLGLNHDGKSLDTGLLKHWPVGGPKLLWKADDIGVGFSSPSIADGMIYVSGDQDGKLMVFAMDLAALRSGRRKSTRAAAVRTAPAPRR